MAHDADDHGRQESQRREHHGSAGRDGTRIARIMTVTVRASSTWRICPSSFHVMMERKPQATTMPTASSAPRLRRESLARLARSQSSPIVQLAARWPNATGPVTTASERGAADQHHAGEEEEVESERHEEERLADQRQALPHELQPVGGVQSPLEDGTSPGLGWASRECGHADGVRRHG